MLGHADGGEEHFDLFEAAHAFGRSAIVREVLEAEAGKTLEDLGEAVVDMFALGIARPYHHNRHYERWIGALAETTPAAAEVVRSAAFSFITAWTHLYGGISAWKVRGTLVEPTKPYPRRDPASGSP